MPSVDDYAAARTYGINEIRVLNSFFFKVSTNEAKLDHWYIFLRSIVTNSNYCQIKTQFRQRIHILVTNLEMCENWLAWRCEKITMCSLPIIWAGAERGFPTLKYIRDTHRNRLVPENQRKDGRTNKYIHKSLTEAAHSIDLAMLVMMSLFQHHDLYYLYGCYWNEVDK